MRLYGSEIVYCRFLLQNNRCCSIAHCTSTKLSLNWLLIYFIIIRVLLNFSTAYTRTHTRTYRL